mmetsp:Transcript_29618/g.92525  ORF Transcript_29618/g.92525 Transcript_29618/m.92525 type:complete len:157 (-) Transcript_29618:95-565(-)
MANTVPLRSTAIVGLAALALAALPVGIHAAYDLDELSDDLAFDASIVSTDAAESRESPVARLQKNELGNSMIKLEQKVLDMENRMKELEQEVANTTQYKNSLTAKLLDINGVITNLHNERKVLEAKITTFARRTQDITAEYQQTMSSAKEVLKEYS